MTRKLCGGQSSAKSRYVGVSFALNLITTVLIIVSISFDCWDHTVYKINGFLNSTCESKIILGDCSTHSNFTFSRFQYQTADNKSGSCRELGEKKSLVMYWDVQAKNCTEEENNLLRSKNASVLLAEKAGIWEVCRDTDNNKDAWNVVKSWCPRISECFRYMSNDITGYCCGRCPFDEQAIKEMDEVGHTTREAIHTAISSTIVTIILQILSYIEVVISWTSHYVTITRMTGITVLLSGVFLAFALVMNHYKVNLMNDSPRSLPYLPTEMGQHREVSIGWCMWMGWTAVVFSILACVAWIQFGRHLVYVANKGEIEKSMKKSKDSRPKSRAIRELSAATKSMALRAKNVMGQKGPHNRRSISVNSYSHGENGNVSAERVPDIQVQEI